MPVSAAASAREILTSLHDVMAARTTAQAKLNSVVGIIAAAIDSEPWSRIVMRSWESLATVQPLRVWGRSQRQIRSRSQLQ